MVCPHCKKDIEQDWIFCGWCGVNVAYYHEALKCLKKGKHLEEIYRYDEALTYYQRALSLDIAPDVINPLLEKLSKKIARFIYLIERGDSLKREKRWRDAYLSFKEASLLNPIEDTVRKDLILLGERLQRRGRKRILYGIIILTMLVSFGGGYLWYINTPEYLARKTLIESAYSTSAVVRRKAIEAMGNVGERRFLPIIKECLLDPDVYVRQEAIKALYKIEGSRSVEFIRPFMEDDDKRVRITTAKILAELSDTSAMNYLKRFMRR